MKNMGAIFVYVNPLYRFTIDVSAYVLATVNNQTPLAGLSRQTSKRCAKQAGANN